MNQFDTRYEIRLANSSDIDLIMDFIDKYWKKGHIMSRDRDLFRYEYQDGNQINFILAIDKNTDYWKVSLVLSDVPIRKMLRKWISGAVCGKCVNRVKICLF